MNRESIVAELANVLQVTEEEAERLLRAFAKVLGPFAVELPPTLSATLKPKSNSSFSA
jgi:hypothetical protein